MLNLCIQSRHFDKCAPNPEWEKRHCGYPISDGIEADEPVYLTGVCGIAVGYSEAQTIQYVFNWINILNRFRSTIMSGYFEWLRNELIKYTKLKRIKVNTEIEWREHGLGAGRQDTCN